MPVVSSPEEWGVCDSCGEIVRQTPDRHTGQLYHSATCPERPPGENRAAPAGQHASSPDPGGHEDLGTSFHDMRGCARRMARALLPGGQARSPVPALAMAAAMCVTLVAVILLSGRPAGKAVPAASSPHAALGTARPTPASASPGPASPAPNPVSDSAPNPASAIIRQDSPSPASTPAASVPAPNLVLNTFQDGTDGWMREWGNISLTPTTQPAFDGASLLLTTSGDSNAAIGSGSDGTTQLKAGDTVTYHVWSSGQPGSVQAYIADDNNNIYYAGSAELTSSAGWFTLTWTVPSSPSIEGIGLQINNPSPRRSLTLAFGGLSWPQN